MTSPPPTDFFTKSELRIDQFDFNLIAYVVEPNHIFCICVEGLLGTLTFVESPQHSLHSMCWKGNISIHTEENLDSMRKNNIFNIVMIAQTFQL